MNTNLRNKYICFGILAVFFSFVWYQMSSVVLYHDDYGYLSLTYHNINANSQGYVLRDILYFLYKHYMTHGGRVLYFFIEIILGRVDIWALRIVQSVVVFFIMYIIIRYNEYNVFSALTAVILYLSLPLSIVSDGMYWFTASVLYVFPMLPFLVGSLLFHKTVFKEELSVCEKWVMYISLFFASFSQEQISCAIVFVATICALVRFWLLRSTKSDFKLKEEVITGLLLIYAGFLILTLCPGSYARASVNKVPFFERIADHSHYVIHTMYLENGKIFQLALVIITMFTGLYLYKMKAANKLYIIVNLALSVFMIFVSLRYYMGLHTGLAKLTHYNWPVVRGILCLYTLLAFYTVYLYCRNKKNMTESILFLGGVLHSY